MCPAKSGRWTPICGMICDRIRQNETENANRRNRRSRPRDPARADAGRRLTNVELAERVHLSPSACLRRVRMLEESGLIDGYVMLLDPVAAGLAGRGLRLRDAGAAGTRDARPFRAQVRRHAEIIECYLAGGRPRTTCCASPFATRAISSASAIPPRAALHREPRPTSTLLRLRTIRVGGWARAIADGLAVDVKGAASDKSPSASKRAIPVCVNQFTIASVSFMISGPMPSRGKRRSL